MWISPDKRRLLTKETAQLPYLIGLSKAEAESGTQCRNEILETVFDQFIRPDDASVDVTSTGRWKRARQLWKSLLVEKRASFFIDLKASAYIEWIKTGGATILPCTTDEVEERNRNLPEFQGKKSDVNLAKEVRATLLKFAEDFRGSLLEKDAPENKRNTFDEFCDDVRRRTDAEWFINRRPESFLQYEKLLKSLMRIDSMERTSSKVETELKRMSELGKYILLRKRHRKEDQ